MKRICVLFICLIMNIAVIFATFIKGETWNSIFVGIGLAVYALLGILLLTFAFEAKSERSDVCYLLAFGMILAIQRVYTFLTDLRLWILGWPIATKILVPCLMFVVLVLGIVSFIRNKDDFDCLCF